MSVALGYLFLVAWAVWVGAIIFFSFVVAPTAFRALEVEHAGKFMRVIFPRYYLTGILCGLLGLCSGGTLIATRFWPWQAGSTVLVLLLGMVVIAAWARQRLVPRLNSLRDEAHEARLSDDQEAREEVLARWQRLHRLSVRLNLLALLLGLATGWAWLNCWLVLPGHW
jgi:uncharacterized membrane protein